MVGKFHSRIESYGHFTIGRPVKNGADFLAIGLFHTREMGPMGECWTFHTYVESFLDSSSLFLLPSFSLSPTLSLLIVSSNLDGTERDREEKLFDA